MRIASVLLASSLALFIASGTSAAPAVADQDTLAQAKQQFPDEYATCDKRVSNEMARGAESDYTSGMSACLRVEANGGDFNFATAATAPSKQDCSATTTDLFQEAAELGKRDVPAEVAVAIMIAQSAECPHTQ